MDKKDRGIIEKLSWKSIAAALITVIGFYFGIPEYVFTVRPRFVIMAGSDVVSFVEGAISGAITAVLVLKLYSQVTSQRPQGKSREIQKKPSSLHIVELEDLTKEIDELLRIATPLSGAEKERFEFWKNNVINTLEIIFGEDSKELKRFRSISFYPMSLPSTNAMRAQAYHDGLTSSRAFLNSVIRKLRLMD